MSTALLIIDPQRDFIITPEFLGSLGVPGAHEDMQRLGSHIKSKLPDSIYVTLDTHQKLDIAHAMWWVDAQGNHPNPFTLISVEDLASGKWKTADPAMQEYSNFYVQELAKNNKYQLCVWPYHCIDGTEGHKVDPELQEALSVWEASTGNKVQYIYKGKNPKTEHYSGLQAEVVLADDPDTELNVSAIKSLDKHDTIEVAGEALSHCVGSTLAHLLENVDPAKVHVLTDCMSSVPGFESNGEDFLKFALNKGATLRKVGAARTLKM